MQEPYMRQFQQQTVPGLAERFSQVGGRNSSAFNQAMGQAGANLSSSLGGMFEQMRGQNLGNLLSFANAPFQQGMNLMDMNFGYEPPTSGAIVPILQMLGMLGGGMLGGPMGAGIGSGIGNTAGQYLSRG